MRRSTTLVMVGAFLTSCGFLTASAHQEASSDLAPEAAAICSFANGNADFAVDLYRNLDQHEGKVFYSPRSVSAMLGMISAGARGATASEMEGALRLLAHCGERHASEEAKRSAALIGIQTPTLPGERMFSLRW